MTNWGELLWSKGSEEEADRWVPAETWWARADAKRIRRSIHTAEERAALPPPTPKVPERTKETQARRKRATARETPS